MKRYYWLALVAVAMALTGCKSKCQSGDTSTGCYSPPTGPS